jgi:hypothetical protein
VTADAAPDPAFAVAVEAVLQRLDEDGYEIVEYSASPSDLPHIVAERDGDAAGRERLFVLVQGVEGPTLDEFSEEIYHGQLRPYVAAITWHPSGQALAAHAAKHAARAVLGVVALMATGETDPDGEPQYLAKSFPLRDLDASGVVAAMTDDE